MRWRPWRHAWVWGVVLLLSALPWYLSGAGVDLLPYLLTLVGGWTFGFSFVNLTLGMRARRGLVLHVAAAVLFGLLVWATIFGHIPIDERLPEAARAVLFLLQMASIPAIGWVWLALIGRATSAVGRPRSDRVAPEWTREEGGSVVRFSAVPMRLRELHTAIVVIVLAGGGAVLTMLIALDSFVFGPRMLLLILGLLVGLPAYLALSAHYRRRTVDASVRFDSDSIRVTYGTESVETPLQSIRMLRWRTAGEEARIELRTDTADLSLVAGLARVPKGVAAELPPLPRFVRRSLALAGLEQKDGRAKGLTTWTPAAGNAGDPA